MTGQRPPFAHFTRVPKSSAYTVPDWWRALTGTTGSPRLSAILEENSSFRTMEKAARRGPSVAVVVVVVVADASCGGLVGGRRRAVVTGEHTLSDRAHERKTH